jgi:hypothetical protein
MTVHTKRASLVITVMLVFTIYRVVSGVTVGLIVSPLQAKLP